MAPSATGVILAEPQPSCRDSSCTSQSLSEPAVVTPIFLPLRSSGLRMSGATPTIKPMLSGSLASAPTALAGTPLARNPMAGPEPRPKSTEFATIPCCNLASPAKITVSTSRSCFAQMPSAAPISTGAKENGWLTDLPTRTLSAAAAADVAPTVSASNNTAHMRCRSKSTPLGLVVIATPRQAAQLAQKFDDLFVRHVFLHVVAVVMHDVLERPARAGAAVHCRPADRNDVMDHHQVGHAEHALERLLDMDGDVLRAQAQGCGGEMHQGRRIGERVGEMALVAAESERALHRTPLAAAVAENDDQHRRRRPGPRHAVLRQLPLRLRIVALDLIGWMAQRLLAHLLHPEDEIRIDVAIGLEQFALDRLVLDHDEFPRLRIRPRHRPAAGFESLMHVIVRNRIGLEPPDAHAPGQDVVELVVIRSFGIFRHLKPLGTITIMRSLGHGFTTVKFSIASRR